MERSLQLSRRELVRLGVSASALAPFVGLTAAAKAAAEGEKTTNGLNVGVATYSFIKVPLDKTLKGLKQLAVHHVSIKEAHLPLKSTTEQRKEVIDQFKEAGITPLSCGNISLKDDPSYNRNAFEYARDCGIPTIVCSPLPSVLPELEKLVKEFDIKLAIHNHGPEDKSWPSPYSVWDGVQNLDERIGLCIDIGHTARAGVDPAEAIRRTAGRLYDIHFKDEATVEVGGKSHPIEVGRGALDVRKILAALLEIQFKGNVGLEYEKDAADPLAGVAESLGYIRGVLAGMKQA